MHRLKALLIVLVTFGLSLHAHASNESEIGTQDPPSKDSLKTVHSNRLITFGVFTLRAIKKESSPASSIEEKIEE